MPERRFRYVQSVHAAGLSNPDDTTLHLLWQIVDEGVLGASNHVRLTQELLTYLLETGDDPGERWQRAALAAEFIADTRGREAPVVGNTVRLLLQGLEQQPLEARLPQLAERIHNWRRDADRRLETLVARAVATLGAGRSIIAYDYSSTVAAVVVALCKAHPDTRVVVPESRAIAGGRRYLEAFLAAGIPVRLVLDAAFEQVLEDSAVVLLGAESLRCDGSLTNTVGSLPLARLARARGCPAYGCGDLLKLDLRSYEGYFAEPAVREFPHLLEGIDLPPGAVVDTRGPELEVVPPTLITALLTDHGPVPPGALWGLGREIFHMGGNAP